MAQLRQADLAALLDVIVDIGGAADADEFAMRVLPSVRKLVPGTVVCLADVDFRRGGMTAAFEPSDSVLDEMAESFHRYWDEHPQMVHFRTTGENGAVKVSDFLSASEFHRLALYQESFRRIGSEDQFAMLFFAGPLRVIGLSVDRDRRTFSERDRLMLDLLRPHLAQAYRMAEARTRMRATLRAFERALEEAGEGLVLVTQRGRVRVATQRARQLFASYFGGPRKHGDRLPPDVEAWLRVQQGRLQGEEGIPVLAEPLVMDAPGRHLTITFIPGTDKEAATLLLLDEQKAISSDELRRLGLTPRQCEVLKLLIEGRTNDEIARLLFVSRRTVEKHLEHIYDLLGVRTRTAAAALVAGAPGAPLVSGK